MSTFIFYVYREKKKWMKIKVFLTKYYETSVEMCLKNDNYSRFDYTVNMMYCPLSVHPFHYLNGATYQQGSKKFMSLRWVMQGFLFLFFTKICANPFVFISFVRAWTTETVYTK